MLLLHFIFCEVEAEIFNLVCMSDALYVVLKSELIFSFLFC